MSLLSALIPLALLGAIIGLDVVSFPQAMWSRPIVGATLGGALVGRPDAGLVAGVVLELLAMDTLPVGASRYPDWGTAGVIGGAIHAAHPSHPSGALAVAILAALATAWAGSWSMYALRKLNGSWHTASTPDLDAGSRDAVMGLQLRGLAADLLRGALVTVVALVAFDSLANIMLDRWSLGSTMTNVVIVVIAAGTASAAAWTLTHSTARTRWYAFSGVALGVAIMALR
ncbi:MAG: PTS sugar transporter subunit IIC [Gemmatimonadota bacterium]|nr:PTS sugar transporter subunit IIC [Gemmatimonadota bacterium]